MIQIKTSTPFAGCVDSRQGGRAENQDACGYADTPLGLLVVVCDGMGGGPGGKMASSTAVEVIIQTVRASKPSDSVQEVLQYAIKTANHALLRIVQEKTALKGMGTTVSALLINNYSATVAHIGDSRVYQFRRGGKKFRTFDHSMVFELVKNGTLTEEQARLSAQSNVITRALGMNPDVEAEITELPYEKGDRFMLCTDGIWGPLQEKELVKITAGTQSLAGSVEKIVIHVDERGFSNGGKHDNLTVAFIQTKSNSILKEKMSTRTRNILLGLALLCCLSLIGNIIQWKSASKVLAQFTQQDQERYIDSLLDVRADNLNRKLESRFQRTIDSLSQQIKEKNYKGAEIYLQDYNAKQGLVKELDRIIAQLKELRNMESGDVKNKKIKATMDNIKGLSADLKKCGVPVETLVDKKKGILTLLGQSMAQRNDGQSQGHYDAIIQCLDSMKVKVRN